VTRIENRTCDEIKTEDTATLTRMLTNRNIELFAIVLPVAAAADIFVVPDREAGNTPVKQLEDVADAGNAGIALGARMPIILTSRADEALSRLGSCAIALLLARHQAGA